MKVFIKIAGVLIGLIVIYAAIVTFAPGFSVPRQPFDLPQGRAPETPDQSRRNVNFEADGTVIRAWLYLPEGLTGPVPCVVMANGLGGTKAAGLDGYARRFRDEGWAVLVFDYRFFGESDGEPRQLVWIPHQLADYRAAVKYARSLVEVDPDRIALWGTSLSGGHVVVIAAEDHRIACVAAQCPGLDGRATALENLKRQGLWLSLRYLVHGQRDLFRAWLGLSPHKVPLAGRPGSIALLSAPGAYEGYRDLVPEGFVNEACARIIIRGDKYRPVEYASRVRCPVLLQICDNDNLAPAGSTEETQKALGSYAQVEHYAIGHFDIYSGINFEKSVSDQISFFQKHLSPDAS